MPTVLELTPAERAHYIEVARKRTAVTHAPEDLPAQHEREMLLSRARQAAAELKARFGVLRVILFGSMAHEAWFTTDSDVDLAVVGLQKECYWDAWRVIEQFIPDRPVDLVELDAARPSLRQSIEDDGIEL